MSAPDSGAGPTHPPGHPGTGAPPPPPPPSKGHLPPTPAWRYETTQPGPGPKPEGPTGPTPTGPGPQRDECDCGHGDLPQAFHLTPCPMARPLRLPTLAKLVDDASKILEEAVSMLSRQWDPTTGPQQDGGVLPSAVDAALGAARTNIRIAMIDLDEVAAMIPARQSTNSASLPGGPTNHPAWTQGEGLTPGLDTGFADRTTEATGPVVGQPVAGSSHLTRSSPRVSGGRTPGLVDSSAPTDGSLTTALTGRGAGDSSECEVCHG